MSMIGTMTRIIAIANQKGGVGKTTTAINLSAALAHFKRSVLLIDMDPQGNAGRGLGVDITLIKKSIYEALAESLPIREAVIHTSFDGVDIIPANLRLASLEASLYRVPIEKPFFLLRDVLSSLKREYDYIVIDCPPSLGLLSLNALACSDSVIIPVQCEYFAMEAVAAILSSVSNVQKEWNPLLKIEGFLLTMFDPRYHLSSEISSQVRYLFKEDTFHSVIPRNQSVAESQARKMPVTAFRPTSQGSLAYLALAKEVIDHEEN